MGLYLIETYLLSVVGYMLYHLTVRRFAAPIERKLALLGIIAFSLALPFMVDRWEGKQGDAVCLHRHTITEMVCVDYCPSELDLPVCYDIAAKQEHFCQCSRVMPENILIFKQNKLYDGVLYAQPLLNNLLWPILFLLGSILGLKITYLLYLIASSRRQKMTLNGYTFTVLYPKQPLAVGSFRLWKGYIIWQRELSELTPTEQNAVLWHEIAHLQQCDTWLKMALDFLQFIWLINPVFYLICSELHKINEHIADKFAIKKVQNIPLYVNVLLKMKQAKTLTVFQTFKSSGFKERVVWLLSNKRQNPNLGMAFVGLLLLAAMLWTTTQYTMPQISKEMDKVKVYEKLAKDNESSGRSLFCKHCLLEQLNTPPTFGNNAMLFRPELGQMLD